MTLFDAICHLTYEAKLKAQTPLWSAFYVLPITYDMTLHEAIKGHATADRVFYHLLS